jgi:hypothetical protein
MKVKPFVNKKDGPVVGYMFKCPGCGDNHAVNVNNPEPGPNWTFNGDANNPTFSPSLLVRSGHYAGHHKPGDDCWCTYNEQHTEEKVRFTCYVCHSFIRDGKIQFLGDCTHALAGQTVELPEIEE